MLQELKKHLFAYIILITGLLVGVIIFLGVWPDRFFQRLTAGGISIFYILWGVTTHFKARHLTRRIVLEYVGVGALAGILLLLVTI